MLEQFFHLIFRQLQTARTATDILTFLMKSDAHTHACVSDESVKEPMHMDKWKCQSAEGMHMRK